MNREWISADGGLRFVVGKDRFSFSLFAGEVPLIPAGRCRVGIEKGDTEEIRWASARVTRKSLRLQGSTPSGAWVLTVSGDALPGDCNGLRLALSGRVAKGRKVAFLEPVFAARVDAEHALVHGRSAGGCHAHVLPEPQPAAFTSWLHLVLTKNGRSLMLAQDMRQARPSRLEGTCDGAAVRGLAVRTPCDPPASGAVEAEPVSLFYNDSGRALLEAWASRQSPRPPAPAAPVAGWNSWDYYRWTITEEAVLRNAEFIAADPVLSRHVKRIIVDDGWQYCYGEWEANPLFPHGMKWLAGRLSRLGFEPGLWICPGVAEPHSRIAQWDMDMLARGRSGLPCLAFSCMERKGFILDPTVPKTRRWIQALFTRYADMGYKYFKLDFLMQTMKAPVFADPAVPKGDIVRLLLEPARRALRGRARLMGCGYDFFAGAATVDEARTSSDIHARWDCIKENVASIAGRWWAQGRFWGNDPDFALCRGPETSRDPDLARLRACLVFVTPGALTAPHEPYLLSTMTLAEARTLLSLVLISGGAVNLSDDLTRLNAAGLDLARRTVAAERGGAGIALDLFRSRHPAVWSQRLAAGQRVLLINWQDKAADLSFEAGPAEAGLEWRNFWTDEPVVLRRNRLEVRLAPHACLLAEGVVKGKGK